MQIGGNQGERGECPNPFLNSPLFYEDVNDHSSVWFAGAGFLHFDDLPISALHSDVVFSARTDQSRALFIYEHDHRDNFIQVNIQLFIYYPTSLLQLIFNYFYYNIFWQIHLANEYRIVLTVNNGNGVANCSILAEPGKGRGRYIYVHNHLLCLSVFNDMRWHQFEIERSAAFDNGHGGGTIFVLNVDNQQCQIGAQLAMEKGGGGNNGGGGISLASTEMEGRGININNINNYQ
jgi:hypothetical protein